ncbi:MAG: sensor histidine kinase [Chloroflexi bacterium]|nr:sensor histidine kinase [Chloroflexota bacterium]
MLPRIVNRQRRVLLIGSGLVTGSAVLYPIYGLWAVAPFLAVALIYLAVILGMGILAELSMRAQISLRWKISGTIFLMLGVLLAASLVALAASQLTHNEIHAIQELQTSAPLPAVTGIIREAEGPQSELLKEMQARLRQVPAALDRLENTQHVILTWIPAIVFVGGLIAVALGAALSSSMVRPLETMSEATRRIASGDFSQPIDVSNRDELGELAKSLNNAAQDLTRLQDALLAEERARSLQERVVQVTLAQEEERRRISRELHDGLGPSLADLSNRLSVCRQLVRSDPVVAETRLDEVSALLRGHIEDIRELISELRPLGLDQLGLVEALRQYTYRFSEESGIEASITAPGSLSSDPLTELTVYRVVQESLTNVRKHGEATSVQVTLRGWDDKLEVIVADNGKGFDPEQTATHPGTGIGLISMRERAELVGGSFTVKSNPGQGCQTVLRVPARG